VAIQKRSDISHKETGNETRPSKGNGNPIRPTVCKRECFLCRSNDGAESIPVQNERVCSQNLADLVELRIGREIRDMRNQCDAISAQVWTATISFA
jgi:hypothetical protein